MKYTQEHKYVVTQCKAIMRTSDTYCEALTYYAKLGGRKTLDRVETRTLRMKESEC